MREIVPAKLDITRAHLGRITAGVVETRFERSRKGLGDGSSGSWRLVEWKSMAKCESPPQNA
jgi:hypothetical protein